VHTTRKSTIGENFYVFILERLEGPVCRMKIFTVFLCTKLTQIWATDAIMYLTEIADSLWTKKRECMCIYKVGTNCLIRPNFQVLIVAVRVLNWSMHTRFQWFATRGTPVNKMATPLQKAKPVLWFNNTKCVWNLCRSTIRQNLDWICIPSYTFMHFADCSGRHVLRVNGKLLCCKMCGWNFNTNLIGS
jgi:hypothetical protein